VFFDRATGSLVRREPGFNPCGYTIEEFGRIGIEAEADLTAALNDERRSPIDKETQPLTFFFRAEPAEKRGTLPPAMVMRSPVRGFTP
jgi:hypothetical protein